MSYWLIIFFSEIVGSALISLIGNGIMANTLLKDTFGAQKDNSLIQISLGWSCAITLGIIFGLIIGGQSHLNFIITFFYLIVDWNIVGSYMLLLAFILGQLIGFILGQILVLIIYYVSIKKTLSLGHSLNFLLIFCSYSKNPENKLNSLCSEIIGSILFLVGYVFIVFNFNQILDSKNSYILTFILVFALSISLGGITGPCLSPTRDLSLRLLHQIIPFKNKGKSLWAYSWIPIIGPLFGTIIIAPIFIGIL